MIYAIVKQYVKVVLWFFYGEIDVRGLENIPRDRPIILSPNHQNAFMDAVIVACALDRPIYSLARAGVFQTSLSRRLLGLLNMMPIYRFRDGLEGVRKNDKILDKSLDILHKRKTLLIFPEGNHSMKYTVRPLQKGVARIVFNTYEKNIAVNIVPVGLYYDNHTAIRSRVLLQFGKPIPPASINREGHYQSNYKSLLNLLSTSMRKLTLHIPEAQYEELHNRWKAARVEKGKIFDQLVSDQELVNNIEKGVFENRGVQNKRNTSWKWLLIPIALYGIVNHLLPYLTLKAIINTCVKDTHFLASIKLAIGMVVVPFFYIVQCILLYYWGLPTLGIVGYLLSLPWCGLVALDYRKWLRAISASPYETS